MTTLTSPMRSLAVPLLLSLAACGGTAADQGKRQQAPGAQASGQIPSPPANDPNAPDAVLLAAAEPFEALTEGAFGSDPAALDGLIAKAKSGGEAASRVLAPHEAKALSEQLARINTARSQDARADLAIAAVEGYRTLVSSVSGTHRIPKEVNLLDYAGFRYQANLKAKPVRWADAAATMNYADRQWQAISGAVTDAGLKKAMSDALAQMRRASERKDAAAAMSASTAELDLVDRLEKFFDRA